MKQWKYIKGSEKDFEGAPDWATCACQGANCIVFYENIDYSGRWKNKGSSSHGVDGTGGFPIIAQRELIEVWDGKGLPPVGTVCQWDNGNSDWSTVTVLGINGDDVWVKPDNGSQSFVVSDNDFRPLPDERDLAISDMRKCLTNYNKTDVIHACEQLYDAGYRKVSAAPGFEWRYVCKCCGCRVEPGEELPHGC